MCSGQVTVSRIVRDELRKIVEDSDVSCTVLSRSQYETRAECSPLNYSALATIAVVEQS